MAKFAVGDRVELLYMRKGKNRAGLQGVIIAVGPWGAGHIDSCGIRCDLPSDYEVDYGDGATGNHLECQLRKLPSDDNHLDTTEDPGLTRLKKLLQQDKAPKRRKEKA